MTNGYHPPRCAIGGGWGRWTAAQLRCCRCRRWRWSFEQGGWFDQAPATNTVYIQSGSSLWNLTQTSWSYATNFLDGRIERYNASFWVVSRIYVGVAVSLLQAAGQVSAEDMEAVAGPNTIINIQTRSGSAQSHQAFGPMSFNATSATTSNVPAYVWMSVLIPTNAVALSFDFKLLGDGASDSFVAAINGTNILSLAANLIQTNFLMNSGLIDVSALAGETTELFFGIAGGTSTNTQITVQDIQFYTLQSSTSLDSVGDGIPDLWRAQYFPNVDATGTTTNYLSCATCDADGTGQNNLFKYLAGLNPTNSASMFRILSIAPTGSDLNVTWQTVGGKTNVLTATGSMGIGYTNVSPNLIIQGSGDTTTNWLDAGAATNRPARFYRIQLVP